jgi:SAM-dependent methyltransferase
MPRSAPFEAHAARYDRWFDEHPHVFASERAAVDALLPRGPDVETLAIGVGTGRFAPDGAVGVDPALAPLRYARDRGVRTVRGVAEALPVRDDSVDAALVVTTICFVDDVEAMLREARRAIRPGGTVVIGYVDRDSPLGRRYEGRREGNPFYAEATFVSTEEVVAALDRAGFGEPRFVQTLFGDGAVDGLAEPDPVEAGHGDGSFVVVAADDES